MRNRLIFNLLLVMVCNGLFSQEVPGVLYGGSNNDYGYSISQTSDGGAILAGSTRSYGEGCNDVYLIKLNDNYRKQWTLITGNEFQNTARAIEEVEDGYLITGESWSNANGPAGIYLLKVDFNGDIVFEKTYGINPLDKCFDVISTSSGNILMISYTRMIDIYGGVYLIMTDKYGNTIWDNVYGYEYDEYAFEAIEDEDGNFLIIGSRDGFFNDIHANFKTHDADIWLLKINSDGSEIDSFTYGEDSHEFGNSITADENGGYYLLGSTQSYGAGSFDLLLMKVNEAGEQEWFKTYGGQDFDYGVSMDINNEGDLFLLGTTKSYGLDGSTDFYLNKTDHAGNIIWTSIFGGSENETGHQVIATNDSGCIIIGTTASYGSGNNDVFFTKVDANGNIELFANSDELIGTEYTIAPNPISDRGKVILNDNESDEYILDIFNVSGIKIASYSINSISPYFETTKLTSGIYIYQLTKKAGNKQVTGKIIVK